jgi:hypothetical protein
MILVKQINVVKRFWTIIARVNIEAYGPVAKRWLCKHLPLLGNGRNIHAISNRGTVSSMWSVPICYNREIWSVVTEDLGMVQKEEFSITCYMGDTYT